MLNNVGNFIYACICSHENFKWILDNVYLKLKWQEDKGMQYIAVFIIFSPYQFIFTNKNFQHSIE